MMFSLFVLPFLLMNTPKVPLHRDGNYLSFSSNGNDTYTIDGLLDNSLSEYRLYSFYEETGYHVTDVNPNLFNNVTEDFTLMLSKDIANIPSGLFNNNHLKQINYTGSETEWNNLSINVEVNVYFYECDEGFINYWNTYVRPNADSDICSMSKEEYLVLKGMYDSLTAEDKTYVNAYKDSANQTIESTMSYLSKYYDSESGSNTQPKRNLPQDMTIGIIVSVAIFGMTTISIFYVLKKQGIIN